MFKDVFSNKWLFKQKKTAKKAFGRILSCVEILSGNTESSQANAQVDIYKPLYKPAYIESQGCQRNSQCSDRFINALTLVYKIFRLKCSNEYTFYILKVLFA